MIKMDFSSDIDANLLLFQGSTAFDAWVEGALFNPSFVHIISYQPIL